MDHHLNQCFVYQFSFCRGYYEVQIILLYLLESSHFKYHLYGNTHHRLDFRICCPNQSGSCYLPFSFFSIFARPIFSEVNPIVQTSHFSKALLSFFFLHFLHLSKLYPFRIQVLLLILSFSLAFPIIQLISAILLSFSSSILHPSSLFPFYRPLIILGSPVEQIIQLANSAWFVLDFLFSLQHQQICSVASQDVTQVVKAMHLIQLSSLISEYLACKACFVFSQ